MTSLTPQEKKICADMGLQESDYLAAKVKQTQHSPAPTSFRSGQEIETDRSRAARESVNQAVTRQLGPVVAMVRSGNFPFVASVGLSAEELKMAELLSLSESEFSAVKTNHSVQVLMARKDQEAARALGPSRISVKDLCTPAAK
jgi:hypothetical protein